MNPYPASPTDSNEPPKNGNPLLIVVSIGIVAIIVVLIGGFWFLHSSQSNTSPTQAIVSANGTVAGTTPDGSALPGGQGASSAGAQSGGASGGNGASQSGGGAGAKPNAPSGPAPVIVTFHGTEDGTIDCHNDDNPLFSAGWTTTNAVKTTIAEDGGAAKPFGPNADTSLPFNCSSKHSYTLTAFSASGATATKTLTFTPVNVRPKQPTGNDDHNSTTTANGNPTVSTATGNGAPSTPAH